jgi:hypothetical protein
MRRGLWPPALRGVVTNVNASATALAPLPVQMTKAVLAIALVLLSLAAASTNAGAAARCPTTWKLVGSDTFRAHDALLRSQGVTTDGHGWFFSWQGGLQHTLDAFIPTAIGTLPPQLALQGDNHIGDIDFYNGLIYAPVEDGDQYQAPNIALYDARTLAYTGVSYPLDVSIHEAGVPWVAIDARRRQVYTAEWDMPHDRLNVFDLQMRFKRFLPLRYPASLGAGFHLSRIQGAKVDGHTLYATRDDADKTLFSIDLRSGEVTKLFALKPTVSAELEGLAVRRTPDGALLHVLIVMNNNLPDDATEIHVSFEHFAAQRCHTPA